MQKLRTFFRTLVKSCTSPAYYVDIVRSQLSFSLKFVAFLHFLLAIAVTVAILIPVSLFHVENTVHNVAGYYPSDLAIEVADGKLSVNQPLPYVVPMPSSLRDDRPKQYKDDAPQNLIVFLSDEQFTGVKDLDEYGTAAIVTETGVYVRSDQGNQVRAFPIPEGEHFSINESEIQQLAGKITAHPFIHNKLYVPFIGVFILVLIFPLWLIGRLMSTLFHALIVFIVAKVLKNSTLKGREFTFSKIWQVVLHSSTPLFLLSLVMPMLGQGRFLQGGWYLLILVIWTMYLLSQVVKLTSGSGSTAKVSPARKVKTSKKK